MSKTLEFWTVYVNADGEGLPLAHFASEKEAKRFAQRCSPPNVVGTLSASSASCFLFETAEEAEEAVVANLKEKENALNKLTEREREILGLS